MKLVDLYAPIRRYSYPIVAAVIGMGVLAMILEKPLGPGAMVGLAAWLAALIGVQQLLRPGKPELATVDEVFRRIGNGRPTFVNFYSNL